MNSYSPQQQYNNTDPLRRSPNRHDGTYGATQVSDYQTGLLSGGNREDKSRESHSRQPTGQFMERQVLNEATAQTPSLEIAVNNENEEKGGYTEFFSWGNDDRGQLGHGADQKNIKRSLNIPKSLSFEVIITEIACGSQHSGFISQEGHVFTFGSNSDGQLGIDDRCVHVSTAPLLVSSLLQRNVFPRMISCGGEHTGVIGQKGDVYMWGRNQQGQCGRSILTEGAIFAPTLIDSSLPLPAHSINCGSLHTVILTETGNLYSFGDNSQGQLGLGNGVFRTQLAVDRPTRVEELKEGIKQVSAGYRHTLALSHGGHIYGMGSNRRQEMGLGESSQAQETNFYSPLKLTQLEIHNVVKVAAGAFSAAITDMRQLIVWGTGAFGVFSTPQKVCMDGVYFTNISISKFENPAAAAIDEKGVIYTWGPNMDGQLGQGDFTQRILPTQIMQLKRKSISAVALGEKFAIALGKNVSLASLRKKKEAKAKRKRDLEHKKQEEQQRQNRHQQEYERTSTSPLRGNHRRTVAHDHSHGSRGVDNQKNEVNERDQAFSTEKPTWVTEGTQKSPLDLLSPHAANAANLRHKRPEMSGHNSGRSCQPPQTLSHVQKQTHQLSAVAETKIQDSSYVVGSQTIKGESPSTYQAYNAQSLRQSSPQNDKLLNLANQNTYHHNAYADRGMLSEGSPLRQKSPQPAVKADHEYQSRSLVPPSDGKQTGISMDRMYGNQCRVDSLNKYASHRRQVAADTHESISQTHQQHVVGAFNEPFSRGQTIDTKPADTPHCRKQASETKVINSHRSALHESLHERQTSHLENMLKQQLDEKQQLIRQQQDIIQELRNHLNSDQTAANSRYDQLNERLRSMERERNDLRTRLASDLRSFQAQKDDFMEQIKRLEQERESDRVAYEARIRRLNQDAKDREDQLSVKHARQQSDILSQEGEKRKVELISIEEKQRQDQLRNEREIQDVRHELQSLHHDLDQARNTIKYQREEHSTQEHDKRLVTEALVQRGKELRDMQERNEHLTDQITNLQAEQSRLKEELSLTIDRKDQQNNMLNDQFQNTVAKMNIEIHDLQKRIESQSVQMDEQRLREEDLGRRMAVEKDCVRQRDARIDQLQIDLNASRNQIEDLKRSVAEMETLRGELAQKFDDLRFDCQKIEEQLKNANQIIQNQEGEIQQLKVQLDRERSKANNLQLDLDGQLNQNSNLRRELSDEQRRLALREQDIQGLEVALNDLKENMGQEYAQKSKDFDNVKRAYDDQLYQSEQLRQVITGKNDEIESANMTNQELQAHASTLLEKINYQEQVILDLEDKNKRLTDLLNSHLYDKAQNYKETVLDRLTQKRNPNNQPTRSVTPEPMMARRFDEGQPAIEPEAVSEQRLQQILRQHQTQQDTLNTHYMALQQQINQQKHDKSPIRSHQIELAATDPSSKLNSDPNEYYWVLQRSLDKHAQRSPKRENLKDLEEKEVRKSAQLKQQMPDFKGIYAEETAIVRGSVASTQMQRVSHHFESTHEQFEHLNKSDASPNRSMGPGPRSPFSNPNTSFKGGANQPNFNTAKMSLPPKDQPPKHYSPLRSRTPKLTDQLQAQEDEMQLQNSSISASNINHRVMANELRNLRSQIATMQRNKVDLEGRLTQYEATH